MDTTVLSEVLELLATITYIIRMFLSIIAHTEPWSFSIESLVVHVCMILSFHGDYV
jgi:hypothetical protein